MDKKSALNIVDRFKSILERNGLKIKKIILFGSLAKGTHHDHSDIDLIIISDDFDSMGYWERIDFLTEAIYEVSEPIEALPFTLSEWENEDSLINDYAKDGNVLYEAA